MKKAKTAWPVWALAAALLSACGSTEQQSGLPGNMGNINSASVSPAAPSGGSTDGSPPETQGGGESASESSGEPESSSAEGTGSSAEKPVTPANDGDGEMSGTVFVLENGRGLVLFGGSYSYGKHYAETLNEYKNRLGGSVNVFSMVVPSAVSFYLPEKYSDMSASEWDHIDYINSLLDGVIPVDAYSAIAEHTDEDIYLRTDNHWQSLGAYYAAREFAETALVDFPELNGDNYEFISREGYVGTLYGYSNEDRRIKDNPETFTYYKPKTEYTTDYYDYGLEYQYTGALMLDTENLDVSSWYLVNMCGDMYTVHVKTAVKNSRKLLIVKDSYGDALPAFLTSSFEDIWVLDMRHFEKSVLELCETEGITDVLFTMNASSAAGGNEENLIDIM
ncbi:MAG: DHHW family protein [Ruminococcus sp.]|nr:DHHW family protein [Ruminococcus sp.]